MRSETAMIPKVCALGAAALFGWLLATWPVSAEDVGEFYKGKTIIIQVGYGIGGGYDVATRLVAPYLSKHIPGQPSVVVQNVPGGGGMKVANAIFNTVPKDGLTLGVFSANVTLEPVYGDKQAHFQPGKFAWIGSFDTDVQACGVWKGAGIGIKTLPDLIAAKKTITFGSTSPIASTSLFPLFFKNAFGAPTKVINGYPGTKEIELAMKRGEVDGTCGLYESTVLGSFMQEFRSGDLTIFVQGAVNRRSNLFKSATSVGDMVKTPEMRRIAELVFDPALLTRPLAAPPGTPADRVSALRASLIETMKDPALVAAGKKMQMNFAPMSGEDVQRMIAGFEATPPDLVKKAYSYTHTE